MEKRIYVVHIMRKNTGAMLKDEFVEILNESGAVFAKNNKDPELYVASLAVPTKEKQKELADKLEAIEVKAQIEDCFAFVDEKEIEGMDLYGKKSYSRKIYRR